MAALMAGSVAWELLCQPWQRRLPRYDVFMYAQQGSLQIACWEKVRTHQAKASDTDSVLTNVIFQFVTI